MAKDRPFRLGATYTPIPKRSCSRSLQTRSLAQKSACKDLSRIGQDRAITPEDTYTPTSNRASSRSHLFTQFTLSSFYSLFFPLGFIKLVY